MLSPAHLIVPEIFFELLLAFCVVERISQREVMFEQVGIRCVELLELSAKLFCYGRLVHHYADVVVLRWFWRKLVDLGRLLWLHYFFESNLILEKEFLLTL